MTAPMLLGLSGKKRMGKDTLAAHLVEHYGYRRFAFADSLKQAALDIDPYVVDDNGVHWSTLRAVYDEYGSYEAIKESVWNNAVREFLQKFGSVMALRDNTIWAGPVVRDALAWIEETGQGAVIPDVRFPWEVALIEAAPMGAMVRVHRSDLPDHTQTDTHISETMLDTLVPDAFFNTTPLHDGFDIRVNDLLHTLSCEVTAKGSVG